jgi:hypothetical protein
MKRSFETRAAQPARRPLTLVLMVGACLALVGNLPLWRTFFGLPEISGLRGLPFSFGLAVRDLLSWPLLGSMVLVALLPPVWLLRQPVRWPPPRTWPR